MILDKNHNSQTWYLNMWIFFRKINHKIQWCMLDKCKTKYYSKIEKSIFNLNFKNDAEKRGNRREADETIHFQQDTAPLQWRPYHRMFIVIIFKFCFYWKYSPIYLCTAWMCMNVLSFVCLVFRNYFWIKVTNWMFRVIRKQSLFSMY